MKILGIETSCDETSCAIVENGRRIISNVIASQIDLHAKTGGVVPEVAAREHILKMIPVLDECLDAAGCGWNDINAIAVTNGPGLVSSLIIGTETASVISYVKDKPLIPVQHIVGHIYSNWLEADEEIKFPVLILTVSGGHNELILMNGHNDFEVIGETRDDAAGEAFDKVARILGLPYPGGPAISSISVKGDGKRFNFPRIFLEKGSLDFSFSGLKTAVLNEVKNYAKKHTLNEQFKADIAASFQETVVEILSEKLLWAAEKFEKIKEIHLAGGVSANIKLREAIMRKIPVGVKFRHPSEIKFCTDNAAMIACGAHYIYKYSNKVFAPASNVIPTTSFEIW